MRKRRRAGQRRRQFTNPSRIAVDNAGTVYVTDTFNHTIRKITPAGVVSTLAGLAGNIGSADGTGSAARFFAPRGVAVDAAGTVYVSDTNNAHDPADHGRRSRHDAGGLARFSRERRWDWHRRAIQSTSGACGGRRGHRVCG